ncbi:MAG: copper chaperone CopZ [Eubacteriales bacterium]|nr:copper chaperone CopZ [Eubacteriales bacterium]
MPGDIASLNVEGMSCQHCVNRIEKALGSLNGIESVKVSLDDKKVVVEYDSERIALTTIKDVINDQGYEVK